MNLVILLGRVGKMPSDALRYTASGKAVISFSLVTDEGYGERKTATWHNIVAWEKTAENIGKHVEQGQQILVEGRLATRSWEASDGTKRYKTEVIAYRVQFLAKARTHGGDGGGGGDDAPGSDDGARDIDPDDVPWN